ncbi:Uncharacterised protein [Vibrio cholerae]|nr:Uncharacterised protein [Vibrio cholerae]CSI61489.1 Uncharacterised protein [Vibrio cholerae]CSI79411.1 Uncharacterised protein [Vibrio cholerae]
MVKCCNSLAASVVHTPEHRWEYGKPNHDHDTF